MNDLQIFKNEQFGEIRTIIKEGQPWIVAKDISSILGYSEVSVMLRRLDNDEMIKIEPTELVGANPMARTMTLINESGFYNGILGSQKPQAKLFKKWVTSEVLPSIRKHGAYMTDNTIEKALMDPDFLIKLATNLKEEKSKRIAAEEKIELQLPKVVFADAVSASHTSILVGDLAKILKQNGINVGANRLFEKLRKEGYLIRRKGTDYNMPTQRSMELGLFQVKETSIAHSDGHVSISKTSKVTGKGQIYFVNKFKEVVEC